MDRLDDYNKMIELEIESSNPKDEVKLFDDDSQVKEGNRYDSFDLHDKSCKCNSCCESVTMKFTSAGLGSIGGILHRQLGPTNYDIDLKLVDRVDKYDNQGKEISDYIINITGKDDVEKVTKNLARNGWVRYTKHQSSLEFGLIQLYHDEQCQIPSELTDASKINSTSPSVQVIINGDEVHYVKLKDIIEHETRNKDQ